MRGILCGFAFMWVIGFLYAASNKSSVEGRYIDYSVDQDTYAVLYVDINNDSSQEKAKQMALKRAVEVTVKKEYRFFQIEDGAPVKVAKTPSQYNQAPGNQYHELITEHDFSPSPSFNREGGSIQPVGVFSAYKLVIHCYKEKPEGASIDACKLTKCK